MIYPLPGRRTAVKAGTVGTEGTDCLRFGQYVGVSRSVPRVLRTVCETMRVGTDFDVLAPVDSGAVQVQKKNLFQYDSDLQ